MLAGVDDPINGDDPTNISTRTRTRIRARTRTRARTGAGAQLELSTALRQAMFGTFSGADNRRSTSGVPSMTSPDADHFRNGFVDTVREAVVEQELGRDALYRAG
ncbi:poly-gamma-glutamate hydrolase family protein [Streptomyces beihaiensis]|uniref:Poly-gamma-glutamate hydrolase family protein n=1 Tax=Streptomyces beihaiensis TaxID=2984495 RepID=A0ABT3U2Z8_9ACTN|nr:poly-gamma-glutamate hydrolase family protein [Streptomyces beihaiensis]MCX3063686.1 poly-gamma-glutamate hydrolase family protein [Streptomyces beihaiensis]